MPQVVGVGGVHFLLEAGDDLGLESGRPGPGSGVAAGLSEYEPQAFSDAAGALEQRAPGRARSPFDRGLGALARVVLAPEDQRLGESAARLAAEQAGLYAIIPDLCKIQASGSMVQNLLEAHNSTLSASAVQGPRTLAEGEGEGGEPGAAAAGRDKILIIDDNSMNRDLLRQGLERRGYRVEEATGGRQGLEYIAEQSYDLVLLDLRMPDLGGIELLQALEEQGRLPQLPVVILSASEDPSDVASCFAHGALDYLVKPLNLAILGVRIRVYLERQRQHQRERQQLQELLQKHAARLPELR